MVQHVTRVDLMPMGINGRGIGTGSKFIIVDPGA